MNLHCYRDSKGEWWPAFPGCFKQAPLHLRFVCECYDGAPSRNRFIDVDGGRYFVVVYLELPKNRSRPEHRSTGTPPFEASRRSSVPS